MYLTTLPPAPPAYAPSRGRLTRGVQGFGAAPAPLFVPRVLFIRGKVARGMRGFGGLGAGTPAQVANTPDGPSILDAQGNTVYTAAQVAANPSLLSQISASGCPSGLIPTYSMAGPQCTVPGGNPTCADPTGVCGSFLLPGQSLSQANNGWVLVGDQWVWNGPGQPNTPSPGAINELTGNLVPTFTQAQLASAAANTQTSSFEGQYYPAASPAGTPAASIPTSVKLVNVSRPGMPAQVGDNFSLTISGSPNQVVTGSATQNGQSAGSTTYGSTDGGGNRVLTGTYDASTVGNWVEQWQVGNGTPASLSFSVAAAGSPATGSSSGITNAALLAAASTQAQCQAFGGAWQGVPNGPGTCVAPAPAPLPAGNSGPAPSATNGGAAPAPTSSGFDLSFLTNTVSIFGFDVPVWALAAAGVGGVALISSMGGRR